MMSMMPMRSWKAFSATATNAIGRNSHAGDVGVTFVLRADRSNRLRLAALESGCRRRKTSSLSPPGAIRRPAPPRGARRRRRRRGRGPGERHHFLSLSRARARTRGLQVTKGYAHPRPRDRDNGAWSGPARTPTTLSRSRARTRDRGTHPSRSPERWGPDPGASNGGARAAHVAAGSWSGRCVFRRRVA